MKGLEDKRSELLRLAFLLASSEIEKYVGWKQLRDAFFPHFRLELLSCLGYDEVQPLTGRLLVTDIELFLEIFAEMKRYGMFGSASYEEIARYLCLVFLLPHTEGSLNTMLKAGISDHSDLLKIFFNTIKRAKK